jgi:outer membrane murein-binding lipoprotein Lpp
VKHIAISVACGLLLASCTSDFSTSGDAARASADELRTQNQALKLRIGELEAKLSEANAAREAAMSKDVLEALPRIAEVRIGSLSGLEPPAGAMASETKPATSVVVYVEPVDGRARFTQAVGVLSVDATLVPPVGSKGEPRSLGRATLSPGQLREAYRSGLTGTHYEVSVPIEPALTERVGTLVIRVKFDDAITGRSHAAERTIGQAK